MQATLESKILIRQDIQVQIKQKYRRVAQETIVVQMQKQVIEERVRRSINFNAKIQQKKQSNIRLPVLAKDRNPYVEGSKKSNVTIDIMIFL